MGKRALSSSKSDMSLKGEQISPAVGRLEWGGGGVGCVYPE
jgi:hypothetical protein